MLEAFRIVQRSIPETHLLWFGARPQAMIRKFSGMPNTHIFGQFSQDKMNDFLAAMDLGWLPLRNTPANNGRWPSKINEYLCAGRPVVSTRVSDLESIFNRHDVGRLSPDRPDPFAQNTIELLRNPDLRASMGVEARKTAEEDFSWELLTDRLENFYSQVKGL